MKNLWLKSRDKAALSIKEASFHQRDQPTSNTPGNQAADQMVEITVKAPAEAVYRAGKKLAQDSARQIKERREAMKEAQVVGENGFSSPAETPTDQVRTMEEFSPSPGKRVEEETSRATADLSRTKAISPEQNTKPNGPRPGSPLFQQTEKPAVTTIKRPKKVGWDTTPLSSSPKGKATRRDIKTANRSVKVGREGVKGLKTPGNVTQAIKQSGFRSRIPASRAAAQQTAQAAKASAKGLKALGKAAAAAAKGAFTAIQNATTLLLSGGGAAMLVVLVICLIGLVAGSSFGIFFSGEDNGTGQTVRTAIAQINQDYQDRLEEIKDSHTFDTLEISGSQAVWKEVLAIYAIKTTTDPEGQEVASMDNEKLGLLAEIFWEMNQLDAIVETHTDSTESETSVETEVTVLVITVTHKTALEMAQVLNFDSNQKEQLQELLSPEFDDLWNELLYGITLGSGNGNLVAVAQSQVGNVGGATYWSWYGFSSRVEWCAIFVSWCADQCGLLDSGALPKFSGVGTGVNWFQSRSLWLPGSAKPEAGMLIFFKWYGSDSLIADHVGIVERVENGRVYTIEGNSSDTVRRNSYPVGYGEILGYGTIG